MLLLLGKIENDSTCMQAELRAPRLLLNYPLKNRGASGIGLGVSKQRCQMANCAAAHHSVIDSEARTERTG